MDNTIEVEVNGELYRIAKVDAMQQFHITRRISPVLAKLGISVNDLSAEGKELGEAELMMRMMEVGTQVVSKMSDEDVEYVIHTSLSAVRRRQGERFAPVMTGKKFQFQDIEMAAMLRLTIEFLKFNLAGFFQQTPDDSVPKIDSSL